MATIEIINSVYKSDKRNIDNSLEELRYELPKNFQNRFLLSISEKINGEYFRQFNVNSSGTDYLYNYLDNMDFSWDIKRIIVNSIDSLHYKLEEVYNNYYRNICNITKDERLTPQDKINKLKSEAYKFEDNLSFFQKRSNIGPLEEIGFVASKLADKFGINNDDFVYDVKSFLRKEETKLEEQINEKISTTISDIKEKFIINSKKMINDLELTLENNKDNTYFVEQVKAMVNEIVTNYKSKGEISYETMNKIWDYYLKDKGFVISNKEKEVLALAIKTIQNEGITILPKKNDIKQEKVVDVEPSLPKEKVNPIILVDENKLKETIELSDGIKIPFKQYLEEFFAPYMPDSDVISLSEGKQISTKEYLETLVFDNASKYGRNVENLISDIKNNRLNNSNKPIQDKDVLIENEIKKMLNKLSAQSINDSMNKFEDLIDKTTNNMSAEIKSNINFTPEQEVYVNKAIERLNMHLKAVFVKVLHNMQKTFESINNFITNATKQTNFDKDNIEAIKEVCESVNDFKSYSVGVSDEFLITKTALLEKIKATPEQERYINEIFTMDIVDFDNYNNQLFNEIQNSINIELSNVLNTGALVFEELQSIDYSVTEEQIHEMMNNHFEELKRNNSGVKR